MRESSIRSVHWKKRYGGTEFILAKEIERRRHSLADLRAFLAPWTAFSDICHVGDDGVIEGNRHFRLFYEAFPNSYFILNDRDTDAWIASRLAHEEGVYLNRWKMATGKETDQLVGLWKQMKDDHIAAAHVFFRDNPRFMHVQIDRNSSQRIAEFLRPSFLLFPEKMPWRNATAKEHLAQVRTMVERLT